MPKLWIICVASAVQILSSPYFTCEGENQVKLREKILLNKNITGTRFTGNPHHVQRSFLATANIRT